MENWEAVLAGLPSDRVVAAAHHAIWLLRRRAESVETNPQTLAESSDPAVSDSDKAIASEIVRAIERSAEVPLHRLDERSVERQIVRLADYAQRATTIEKGASERAKSVLDEIGFATNVVGSTIGAISGFVFLGGAFGAAIGAKLGANIGNSMPALTQERHRVTIAKAQSALVRDQDELDMLDLRLFDALSQFLRVARNVQVEDRKLTKLQLKMRSILDEIWVEYMAKGMKRQLLPPHIEAVASLKDNPSMVKVLERLIG